MVHLSSELNLKKKKLQPSNLFKYIGIYLFTKVQKISRSPTITLIYLTTPIDWYEKGPQQTK